MLRAWLCALCLLLPVLPGGAGEKAVPPPVLLAGRYVDGLDLADYWVSEKYDGVRAWWDGSRLRTRRGRLIAAPAWFVRDWPAVVLDGELWGGRGNFEQTSATVRQRKADDQRWQALRFMVFDLPQHEGVFDQRLRTLQALKAGDSGQLSATWEVVEQWRVSDDKTLMAQLQKVVAEGGEGLMLHHGQTRYRAGRGSDLLKLKVDQDDEARVIAHLPGKGKYRGMTGALLVERADGLRFRLGSGLSDAQRRHPPAIGSVVTYRYNGLTSKGVPRFARFWRVREAAHTDVGNEHAQPLQ